VEGRHKAAIGQVPAGRIAKSDNEHEIWNPEAYNSTIAFS
jgi:hypothetical protein